MHNESSDRRIKKSKSALKDALLTLMERKEFDEIAITDIVKLAELNRGTFYKHYPYKEELLDEILEDITADLIASYRAPYQHHHTFEVKSLPSATIKLFDHVEHYAKFYKLLVKTNALADFQNKLHLVLKKLFLDDLTDMTPNPQIDQELLAGYRAHGLLGMIIDWIKGDFKYSSAYMAKQSLEFVRANLENNVYMSNLTNKD